MAEFTKGPWVIDAFTKNVVAIDVPDDGGDIICSEPDGDASASRWHANASLIAAAPDLYEALTLFVAEYCDLVNSGDAGFWDPETETKVQMARSALALPFSAGESRTSLA